MNINIREIETAEYNLLEDFLFEAIFIPEGAEKPRKALLKMRNYRFT